MGLHRAVAQPSGPSRSRPRARLSPRLHRRGAALPRGRLLGVARRLPRARTGGGGRPELLEALALPAPPARAWPQARAGPGHAARGSGRSSSGIPPRSCGGCSTPTARVWRTGRPGWCSDALDLVGVAWRRSGQRTISVSTRAGVARLDGLIGPKSW